MIRASDIDSNVARAANAAGISAEQAREIIATGARQSGEMIGVVAERIASMSGTIGFLRACKAMAERMKEGSK